ncbi:MAG: UDP-N-acetylglucosamine--N-acetylmuramyl-(pentapeptide) pyrophosphoryl-undecaprenol N-acetylglucosamine transferase, partial [Clostridia bacterium]|nr:UDP-N-acetylglucosamine--N-acetylmuramyl-(pentapeptide) pyrophosphoryl-undecaprenol N-acetylglucosamine transferase [Clostridia bacterium]
TIALSGGGTAGHVLPALALISELKKHFDKIIYLGGNGMEQDLVPKNGIPFYQTSNIKFSRSNLISNLKIPVALNNAANEALEILKREKVDIVFGKGGYASLPAVIGAKKLKLPIVIHESDFKMGLANKFALRFCDAVITSFPETNGGTYIGTPIRDEIFNGDKERAYRKYGLNKNLPTILIFGGSSGSTIINDVVFKTAKELVTLGNVIHVTGKNEKRRLYLEGYHSTPYAEDIYDLYAVSHVVVTRGGANSLAEATGLGKRVICIPLPKSKHSRGDQVDNAKSYYSRGLIDLLPQSELSSDELLKRIKTELTQKERPVLTDTPNAKIVDKILEVLINQDR